MIRFFITVFDEEPTTFTQEQVNSIVAKELEKEKAAKKKLQEVVDNLTKNSKLSEDERAALEAKVRESMTAAEVSDREKQRIEKESREALEATKKEAIEWKQRFETSTIQRELIDAAVVGGAFNPEQFVALLLPCAKLDDKLATKVTLKDKNSKGEDIELVLSPAEAVKSMKEKPDRYGNLFKNAVKAGTGADGTATPGKSLSLAEAATQGPEAYRKLRAEKGLS